MARVSVETETCPRRRKANDMQKLAAHPHTLKAAGKSESTSRNNGKRRSRPVQQALFVLDSPESDALPAAKLSATRTSPKARLSSRRRRDSKHSNNHRRSFFLGPVRLEAPAPQLEFRALAPPPTPIPEVVPELAESFGAAYRAWQRNRQYFARPGSSGLRRR